MKPNISPSYFRDRCRSVFPLSAAGIGICAHMVPDVGFGPVVGALVAIGLSVFVHEQGHLLTAIILGLPAHRTRSYLIGGTTYFHEEVSHDDPRWQCCVLAGPVIGAAFCGLAYWVIGSVGEEWAVELFGVRLVLILAVVDNLMLNLLLPCGPLDGGHLFSWTIRRHHRSWVVWDCFLGTHVETDELAARISWASFGGLACITWVAWDCGWLAAVGPLILTIHLFISSSEIRWFMDDFSQPAESEPPISTIDPLTLRQVSIEAARSHSTRRFSTHSSMPINKLGMSRGKAQKRSGSLGPPPSSN